MSTQLESQASTAPIVFLGPTLPLAEASRILDADYRPPVRRGDLGDVPAGHTVAIVDGVFDHNLAVSPSELRDALARGVRIFGSSSMGALRATEIPGIIGVGRVFEMYRDGEVEDDDEVAVAFDPDSQRPLSVPLVNIRHAIGRLTKPGTISADVGRRLLAAARQLPYTERVYPRIIAEAGLEGGHDRQQLIAMLTSYDLKREDAITLLERLRAVPRVLQVPVSSPAAVSEEYTSGLPADTPLLFWEYGESIDLRELLRFLKLTGQFARQARAAVARFALAGHELDVVADQPSREQLSVELLGRLRHAWDWQSDEELAVTLRDLGIGSDNLEERLAEEVETERRLMALARQEPPELLDALRVQLVFDDLGLKRAATRLGSMARLALHGREQRKALSASERAEALDRVCEQTKSSNERQLVERMARWGVSADEVRGFVETLAWARRGARRIRDARYRAVPLGRVVPRSPKVKGSRRFCSPFARALRATERLRKTIGVTRVALITGLGDIGLPNAQAFRPSGSWSSTVGAGKSETVAGAKVGAVMEEVEKWAQEQFPRPEDAPQVRGSYEQLRRRQRVVDPATLDLPYDSRFRPDLELSWYPCVDLISGGTVLVPAAALIMARQPDDIFYSERGARKVTDSNGLASGFTRAEALTHAICEYVERHSVTMRDIAEANPGRDGLLPAPAIDLATVPPSTARLLAKIRRPGHRVKVRDYTSELGVPCFMANILTAGPGGVTYQDAWVENAGFAAHPDPEVAINGALLEATQTIMTSTAGAREDLVLHARSLGRHERTRARRVAAYVAWRRPAEPTRPFASVEGFSARDARDDVRWLCTRLAERGCRHLLFVDYSRPELRPAHVVRVIIPGLETINPFRTGLRARMALIDDLL